jgi:hypothetical protein
MIWQSDPKIAMLALRHSERDESPHVIEMH